MRPKRNATMGGATRCLGGVVSRAAACGGWAGAASVGGGVTAGAGCCAAGAASGGGTAGANVLPDEQAEAKATESTATVNGLRSTVHAFIASPVAHTAPGAGRRSS